MPARPRFVLPFWYRTPLVLTLLLALLTPCVSQALEFNVDWRRDGKDTVYGSLSHFDFETKTLTVQVADSEDEIKFTSSELEPSSRWMTLVSPAFLQSVPNDKLQQPHFYLAIIFIALPLVLYLFSFWVSAFLVSRRINPLRAVVALPGAWFLSGILILVYLFLLGRYPDQMTLILSLGGLVSLSVAALFISIIYHKSIAHGLVIIILHSILAPLILAAIFFAAYHFGDAQKLNTFFDQHVFTTTGVLAEKKNEA